MKCFDAMSLNDGSVMHSPAFTQQVPQNQFTYINGFLSNCKALAEATAEN